MRQLRVSVPDEFIVAEGGEEAAGQVLRSSAVLELVRKRVISAGRGAELLAMPIDDFTRLMQAHGIPYFDYDAGEVEEEVRQAKAPQA